MIMRHLFLFIAFVIFGMTASETHAAVIKFETKEAIVQVGEILTVQVLLDTQDEEINAVETLVQYSQETLTLSRVLDGDSAVTLWVQEPMIRDDGSILFSGITPGGLKGDNIILLTLEFRVTKEEVGKLFFGETQLLLHDGLGTEASVTAVPYELNILGQTKEQNISPLYVDIEPPESFVPVVTKDADIFSGRRFIVFATEDKNSGIAYYEVKEGELGTYERATSPYEIKSDSFDRTLYVKAVDREGNEFVASIYPHTSLSWYQTPLAKKAILLLCIFGVLLVSYRLFKKPAL